MKTRIGLLIAATLTLAIGARANEPGFTWDQFVGQYLRPNPASGQQSNGLAGYPAWIIAMVQGLPAQIQGQVAAQLYIAYVIGGTNN